VNQFRRRFICCDKLHNSYTCANVVHCFATHGLIAESWDPQLNGPQRKINGANWYSLVGTSKLGARINIEQFGDS